MRDDFLRTHWLVNPHNEVATRNDSCSRHRQTNVNVLRKCGGYTAAEDGKTFDRGEHSVNEHWNGDLVRIVRPGVVGYICVRLPIVTAGKAPPFQVMINREHRII